MVKKGDTLIEVTLAIGIFSMIAIAVVAIMNSGTSGTQTALETTLAREEIDAQAEALRFIQSSYISDKDSMKNLETGAQDNRFQTLWQEITSLAVEANESITKFTPKSCEDVYSGSAFDKAFAINTRKLSSFDTGTIKNSTDSVLFTKESGKLVTASTYPRLIYGSSSTDNDGNDLIDTAESDSYQRLYRSEGVYVVAVRDDSKGTTIVNDTGVATGQKSAFYDFYIRTCWYSTGSSTPSTISTVIRLYDPDAVGEKDGLVLSFDSNGGRGSMSSLLILAGKTKKLPNNAFRYKYVDTSLYRFVGWNSDKTATTAQYANGADYEAPDNTFSRVYKTLYAIWDVDKFNVNVTPSVNDGSNLSDYYSASALVNGSAGNVSQPMLFGSTVKLTFTINDEYPYSFQDRESICQGIKGCTITTNTDKKLAISFTANYAKTASDAPVSQSSGVYHFNVRPIITRDPDPEPEEPEEP